MQTQERPRFRQDLVAEAIEDGGARFIDVMDPDSGNLFRFYEVEYSLACAMDGERDVTNIINWAREELGVSPTANEVRSVIATLGSLGFIDGGAAAHETELVPGVVVGARAHAPAPDVELGKAGTRPGQYNDMPAAPSFSLGAPGAGATPPRPHTPAEDVPLGAAGQPPQARRPEPAHGKPMHPSVAAPAGMRDVSVDLSEQMPVKRDDVKEAVRASKVMQAAEVPTDLLVPSDDDRTIKAPSPVMDRPTPTPRPTPRPMEARSQPEPVKPAVELKQPRQPTPVPKLVTPVPEPPPESRRTSPVLIVVLILVVLGGAAFLLWKLVLDTTDTPSQGSSSSEKPATAPVAAKPAPAPEPKKPAPPPKAKLATEQPGPEEIKAGNAGTVEALEANDKTVKTGDNIVWLSGHKPLETDLAALTNDVEKKLPADIANDEKERDAAKAANKDTAALEKRLADHQKLLETKVAQREAKQADLAKLVIKAPSAGKLAVVAKPGAKVTADDVVAKITREPILAATFEIAKDGPKLAAGAAVKLKDDAHPEKVYDCTVAEVVAAKVKVTCPLDPTLDGAPVTLAN
jgi:hypothetical protein